MALTELTVKQAKAQTKDYSLADEKGLRILIRTTGSKTWQLRYRRPLDGKADIYTIGPYPEISLKSARESRDAARTLISKDVDPKQNKKSIRAAHIAVAESTFKNIAEKWFETISPEWSETHKQRTLNLLKSHLFPKLGTRPVADITPPEILVVLKQMQERGLLDSGKRANQVASQVFRFAIHTGHLTLNPSRDLSAALTTPKVRHFAAITDPRDVGMLLTSIDSFNGSMTVKAALKLSALLFQRPGEIRAMKWDQIDFAAAEWRYRVTKTDIDHIVPLCTQAISILIELQSINPGNYVFPSARGASRCMSENAVRVALRTMGFTNDEMTAHGFRAMARTLLDEVLNFPFEWIEQQMAHAVSDPLGRAYNRTKYLQQRKDMMQKWADYLDQLRVQACSQNIIPFKHREVAV